MLASFASVSLVDVAAMDPTRTLVLSVNNRYARRVLSEFGDSLGATRQVMAVPAIVPFNAWLSQVSDHLSFDPDSSGASHVIDDFAARQLWQSVITHIESDHVLLDVRQVARLAAEADRLLDDWCIDVLPTEETLDYQRFVVWRDHYRQSLSRLDVDDSNQTYQHICTALRDGRFQLPGHTVVLAGFTELSPRMAQLLDALQDSGSDIYRLVQPVSSASSLTRVCVPDRVAEWGEAALWARDQLIQHPHHRYAIVAPNLETSAPLARRVLQRTLGPHGLAFNVAVARPLSEWPLARSALAWLRVLAVAARGQRCPVAEVGQALLAGGCVAHDEESGQRALLDAFWRRHAVINLTPAQLVRALHEYTPQLAVAWQSCLDHVATLNVTSSLVGHAAHLRQVLNRLGFPGVDSIDSPAWQTLEAFDQLLDRLGRMGPAVGETSLAHAVSLLAQLAYDTSFQPQRDPASRLDVLGLLESEGGHWDGVWVLGLTDDVLPAAPQPNPLLPLRALRRVGAPRATPERELQWAHSMFDSLLRASPSVWLSHALQEGEQELRPSPLIAGIPAGGPPAGVTDSPPPVMPLEYVVDDRGPAVSADQRTRGGIALVDTQARNPLWAFACFRLGASQLPAYSVFADRSVRGQFLHRAIELIWAMLPDQAALRRHAESNTLGPLIEQAVNEAGDQWLEVYSPALRQLEQERAQQVLMRWMDIELRRDAFQVVAIERREQWHYANLQLSVRLDRVDQLGDGRIVVIDYKTGTRLPRVAANWTRRRPIDLQLPFYAAVLAQADPGVAALVFSQLNARTVAASGISDGDCGIDGVQHFSDWDAFQGAGWADVLAQWRTSIQALAQEFSDGYASNVYSDVRDLEYCDVMPFLRLSEEYPSNVDATF